MSETTVEYGSHLATPPEKKAAIAAFDALPEEKRAEAKWRLDRFRRGLHELGYQNAGFGFDPLMVAADVAFGALAILGEPYLYTTNDVIELVDHLMPQSFDDANAVRGMALGIVFTQLLKERV
jgi:hypothetical protein